MTTSRTRAIQRQGAPGWLGLVLVVAGCGVGQPARVALQGNLGDLKGAIRDAERQSELDRGQVRELASAVLSRELVAVTTPPEPFPELATCADGLRGVLEDVAAGTGEFSTLAALTLIDAGHTPPGAHPEQRPASRLPVLARRAVGERAGPERRTLLAHGDADVRQGAVRAAFESADPRDVPALLEAARLDPDPGVQRLAILALGKIGGETAVLGLRDLFDGASTEKREHIVEAWATPASFRAGGELQLANVAEAESGVPAVRAALALARQPGPASTLTTLLLVQAAREGSLAERLWVISEADVQVPELRAALLEASTSDDTPVQVLALLRRVQHGDIDAAGTERLRELAGHTSPPVRIVARLGLAKLGHPEMRRQLRADLQAPRAADRTLAAFALLELGDWSGTAHALADDSPAVRRDVACQVLADPRTSPFDPQVPRAPTRKPLGPELLTRLSGELD